MVRVYNHTQYETGTVRDVFTFAARVLKIKGDVPVKITTCSRIRPRGMAYNQWPYRRTLIGKPGTSKDKRMIKCPIGWIAMSLPRRVGSMAEAESAAEWFVDVAIHEMAHIGQFRTKAFTREYSGKAFGKQRRMTHDIRPCELDADHAVWLVKQSRSQNARRLELIGKLRDVIVKGNNVQPEAATLSTL